MIKKMDNKGFTLLELMTVMLIMFLLMGMSTLALRGVVRGSGLSGAVANVRSVLTQARQNAIIHNRPTAVYFSSGANSMAIGTRYGRAGAGVGNPLMLNSDMALPWSDRQLNGARVFNLTRGTLGRFTGDTDSRSLFRTTISWGEGDEFGLAVSDDRQLPDNMEFGSLPNPPQVIFNADGSARSAFSVVLQEKNVPGAAAAGVRVVVNPSTGWVEVED